MLILDIAPIGGSDRYRVTRGGQLICRSSRQPLLDGARRLLDLGVLPSEIVGLRRLGSDRVDLFASVGFAAKLTVEEETRTGRPGFRRWRKFKHDRQGMPDVAPLARSNGPPATGQPSTSKNASTGG